MRGNRQGGWGHCGWVFNESASFVGENEDGDVTPTPGHVRSQSRQLPLRHALECSQRSGLRDTGDASVADQPVDVAQPRRGEVGRWGRFAGLVVASVCPKRIYRPRPPTARTRIRSVQGRKKKDRPEVHKGDGGGTTPTFPQPKPNGRIIHFRITLHQRGPPANAVVNDPFLPASPPLGTRGQYRIHGLESRSLWY